MTFQAAGLFETKSNDVLSAVAGELTLLLCRRLPQLRRMLESMHPLKAC